MRSAALFVVLPLLACTGGEPEDTGPTQLECIEDGTYDIDVHGSVDDASGNPVAGAAVDLRDYGWSQGASLGTATTDASGEFTIMAVGVTDVPNCWGTLLDYTIEASEGGRTGERSINSFLHGAITDASLETDMRSFPVTIE